MVWLHARASLEGNTGSDAKAMKGTRADEEGEKDVEVGLRFIKNLMKACDHSESWNTSKTIASTKTPSACKRR